VRDKVNLLSAARKLKADLKLLHEERKELRESAGFARVLRCRIKKVNPPCDPRADADVHLNSASAFCFLGGSIHSSKEIRDLQKIGNKGLFLVSARS
jgi:hypothetical protein